MGFAGRATVGLRGLVHAGCVARLGVVEVGVGEVDDLHHHLISLLSRAVGVDFGSFQVVFDSHFPVALLPKEGTFVVVGFVVLRVTGQAFVKMRKRAVQVVVVDKLFYLFCRNHMLLFLPGSKDSTNRVQKQVGQSVMNW